MKEITLLADRDSAEKIGDMMMEAGASSYTTRDADEGTPAEKPLFGEPGLEPDVPAWEHSLLSILVDDGFDWETALAIAAKSLQIEPPAVKSVEAVPDVDWVRVTQAQFKPIRASRRLWIVPSWDTPPEPGALNMRLDPGVAFGTGSHPTTHLCIQWLDEHLSRGASVLDYGCGTGVLAIAASMFGAGSVEGCDIDPLAVEASRFNAKNNGVAGSFCLPEGIPRERRYDVVVANILCNPLISLAPVLCGHVARGGFLVLSGILSDQVDRIAEAYRRADPAIRLERWREEEGWNVICARAS